MERKKIMAVVTAFLMLNCLVSCTKTVGDVKTDSQEITPIQTDEENTTNSVQTEKSETKSEVTTERIIETYPDYPISYPDIEQQDTGDLYEAETAVLNGDLKVANDYDKTDDENEEPKKSFSGEGYVTGFKDGTTSVTFKVNVPTTQHYDLSFSISSDKTVNCSVLANGNEISNFKTRNSGKFTLVTIYGVFLSEGETEIEFRPTDGDIRLDYMRLSNNVTLSELSYEASDELANKNSGEAVKEVMSFLTENYGDYIITGQYVSDYTNKEIDIVYQTTGKYPVIRFSALNKTDDSSNEKELKACEDWYKDGGIVGLMWYWESPSEKSSVYSKESDFNLFNAMTSEDIAMYSIEYIQDLRDSGVISDECFAIVKDIDAMSEQLSKLNEAGVPVLWRPLHEGYGDWFWWGASGMEAYRWLWQLMYTRMTDYFGLDNLIWVWNGQSASTIVDKTTFDIASVDIYLDSEKDFGSRYDQFAAIQKIAGSDKLIALSECSSVPDIDSSFRDNAVWSFFGLWYGKYLEKDGEYSEEYASKESFIRAYNSDGALTLDEYKAMQAERYIEEVTEPETEIVEEEYYYDDYGYYY